MIQALEKLQPVPKVIVSSRARQVLCRRGESFVLLCGVKAGLQVRGAGVWFSHLIAACIPGRGQGQEPGCLEVMGMCDCVCVYTHSGVVLDCVMSLGFNPTWLGSHHFL